MLNKRGSVWLWVSVIIIILLVMGMFLYMALFKPRNNIGKQGILVNPAKDLSIDEAKTQFNEDFVYYLLASIKAYNLHNPPLSSNKPKMDILVGSVEYSAIIDDGRIVVSKGAIENPDVLIKTSLDEAANMVKYPDSVKSSFESGKSEIQMIASKASLFSKGYLNLYTEITGKSITGNIVRIYAD
jgi:hypothetical protein